MTILALLHGWEICHGSDCIQSDILSHIWIYGSQQRNQMDHVSCLLPWLPGMSSEITTHSFSFLSNNKVYVELGSLVMKFSLPPFQLPTSFNCDKIVVFATFSTLSNQLHLGWQQAWHWLSTNPIIWQPTFLLTHYSSVWGEQNKVATGMIMGEQESGFWQPTFFSHLHPPE